MAEDSFGREKGGEMREGRCRNRGGKEKKNGKREGKRERGKEE